MDDRPSTSEPPLLLAALPPLQLDHAHALAINSAPSTQSHVPEAAAGTGGATATASTSRSPTSCRRRPCRRYGDNHDDAGAGGSPRTQCTAHVFLQRYRELYDPRGEAFLEFVRALARPAQPPVWQGQGDARPAQRAVAQQVVSLLRSVRTSAKFVLRKLASIILPTLSNSRRVALRRCLALDSVPVAENAWRKDDALTILLAVYTHTPQHACIPVDLRRMADRRPVMAWRSVTSASDSDGVAGSSPRSVPAASSGSHGHGRAGSDAAAATAATAVLVTTAVVAVTASASSSASTGGVAALGEGDGVAAACGGDDDSGGPGTSSDKDGVRR